jgi:predicted sulfurtransferase
MSNEMHSTATNDMNGHADSSTDNSNSNSNSNSNAPDRIGTNNKQTHIILFYKYHPLSPDHAVTEVYRAALYDLCAALDLSGRILVGASWTEGLNGTLAGSLDCLTAFTRALLSVETESNAIHNEQSSSIDKPISINPLLQQAIDTFRARSREYFLSINKPVLTMDSPSDFKWSLYADDRPAFPDLRVVLVAELIGTGGALSDIQLDETAQGYLTPKDWHEAMRAYRQGDGSKHDDNQRESTKDTILIDCRNSKEYDIGHFVGSVNPETFTFANFPHWVNQHREMLDGKKVLMYCTGGIRCEKVSMMKCNVKSEATATK